MKKITLFAVMMMAAISAKAQLKVDSLGNAQIGTLAPYNSRLTISGAQHGIYCITTPSATNYSSHNIAIQGYSNHLGYEYSTGVYGRATGSTGYGTVYGISGEAFGGGGGRNYGVFEG